jgi:hypothetical protein
MTCPVGSFSWPFSPTLSSVTLPASLIPCACSASSNLSSEFFSLRDAFRGRYINRPGPMQVGWARDEGDMQIYIGDGALKVLDENPFKTTDRRRAHVFARQPAHKGQRAPTAREEP